MNDGIISRNSIKCPYCEEVAFTLISVEDESIRIACPACRYSFHIDLQTLRVTKRIDNNETELKYKLKCPRCGKHYLLYEIRIDEIISDVCHKCGCVFRGNKLYGKTWISKRQASVS